MDDDDAFQNSIFSIAILACIFGCVGNGHMAWLLGFHVKKNTFSTYFLNLAVADLGTVAFLSVSLILLMAHSFYLVVFLYNFFLATNMASLCFLTIISLERCVSVLFPCWYRHRRPKCLSARLSFLIWTLSGMCWGMEVSFYLVYGVRLDSVIRIMLIVNFWILPSLVAVCTMVLLIKLSCQYRKRPPGSLNTLIILMLLFFLILGGPCIVVSSQGSLAGSHLAFVFSHLFFSVNSSIKPVFCYLVGKQRKCHSTETLAIKRQKVFQDEGNATEGRELMSVNETAKETCSNQTALKKIILSG